MVGVVAFRELSDHGGIRLVENDPLRGVLEMGDRLFGAILHRLDDDAGDDHLHWLP
jgi:hypothetical protein